MAARTKIRATGRRRFARALFWTGALPAAIMAGIVMLSWTGPGERLAGTIASKLASTPDAPVAIDAISGAFGTGPAIGRIAIADKTGKPWLTLTGIRTSWSPLALFTGRIDIDRLDVAKAEIARLPEAGDGGGALPFALRIGTLDAPEITLDEAMAGAGGARLTASGSVDLGSALEDSRLVLALKRTDGAQGSLDLKAGRGNDGALEFIGLLTEGKGGVLAHVLGLKGDPAVAIEFSGGGASTDLSGEATARIDGARIAGLTMSRKLDDSGQLIAVKADGMLQPFAPDIAKPLLEGSSLLDLDARMAVDGGSIDISDATLASESAQFSARGRLALDGESDLSLDMTARGNPVRLAAGDAFAEIRSLKATISGPAGAARLDAQLELAKAGSSAMTAEAIEVHATSAALDLANRAGRLDVVATAEAAGSANASLARMLAGRIETSAVIDIDDGAFAFQKASLASGTVRVSGDGRFDSDTKQYSAKVQATANPAILGNAMPARIGGEIAAAASLNGSPGGIAISDGTVIAPAFDLTDIAANIDANGALDGSAEGAIDDLARLEPKARGKLAASLRIAGTLAAPRIDAKFTSDRIESDGHAITALDLAVAGFANPENPDLTAKLTAYLDKLPVTGDFVLDKAMSSGGPGNLKLLVGDNRIEGAIRLDDDLVPVGDIRLDLPRLDQLAALVLQDMSGALAGTLALSAEQGHPLIAAKLKADRLAVSGTDLRGLDADVMIADPAGAMRITGTAKAVSAAQGGNPARDIALSFSRAGDWTAFDGSAIAPGGIPASASGRLRSVSGTTEIELGKARASYRGLPLNLLEPAALTVSGGVTRISRLALSPGSGRIDVAGSAGSALDLTIRLKDAPLSAVERLAPGAGLSGAVSGNLRVTGQPSNPAIAYDLASGAVSSTIAGARGIPAMAVTVKGKGDSRSLGLTATARGQGVEIAANGSVGLAPGGALRIDARGRAPFALLSRELAAQGMALDGAADFTLSIGGRTAAPVISGAISTAGARFTDARSGISASDVNADIAVANSVATIRRMTGRLARQGSIEATGTVGLSGGFPANLSVRIGKGRYADGKLVAADFDAALTVTGDLAASPRLGGTVSFSRLTVTVPEKLASGAGRLDIRHKNAPRDVAELAKRTRPASGGGGMAIGLTLEAPGRIFVRGRGIDAELGGSLRLDGTVGAPVATGGFTLKRGRLQVIGRRLDFTSGRIAFNGSPVPDLNLVASAAAGSSTVTVTVTGPADDPSFAFTANPAAPEDEVLAQLVFGRSLSRLSPLQIARLAEVAASLTGAVKGPGLVDRLRSAIGADDIDVRTDDAGNATLGVGKYLSDKAYLGLERGSAERSGKATINLDIGKGVKLRGEAGEDGKAKGGIYFERDY